MTNPTDDIYGALGQDWWVKAGEEVRATPQQVRFSAARYNGATRSKAAALAGYKGDAQGLRSAGSRVDDTDTVKALIALAAATEAGTSYDQYTVAEAKLKVGNLVKHSRDPLIVFKGTEVLSRLEREEAAANAQPEESLEQNLASLITLVPEYAAGAFLSLSGFIHAGGFIGSFPFLAEVAPVLSRNYPGDWQRWRAREKQQWVTDHLDRMAAGPLLEEDALIAAVKHKSPKPTTVKPIEADNG